MRLTRLVSLALAAGWCYFEGLAQATFALRNRYEGLDAPVYDWAGSLLWGPQWRIELYGGAASDSLSPVVDFLYGSREIVGLGRPGYFWSSNGDLAVMTVPPSGWAWLQVRIWDVQLGATYEEASVRGMGGYGQSAVFYAQGGNAYDTAD